MMKLKITLDFVNSINCADVEKIYEMMTDDHIFIDSQDQKISGRDKMKQAWIGYFQLFPDYKIEITETLENDSMIVLLGYASGTYKNLRDENNSNYWRIPAAWKAVVKDDKIKLWQVFADNSVPIEILKRNA